MESVSDMRSVFLTACFLVENLIFFNSLSIFYYVYWILSVTVQSESDLLSTDFQIGYIGLCLLKAWRNKNCKYIWQVLLTELNVLTINLMAWSRRQVHTLTQFLHFMSILSLSIFRINMYIFLCFWSDYVKPNIPIVLVCCLEWAVWIIFCGIYD